MIKQSKNKKYEAGRIMRFEDGREFAYLYHDDENNLVLYSVSDRIKLNLGKNFPFKDIYNQYVTEEYSAEALRFLQEETKRIKHKSAKMVKVEQKEKETERKKYEAGRIVRLEDGREFAYLYHDNADNLILYSISDKVKFSPDKNFPFEDIYSKYIVNEYSTEVLEFLEEEDKRKDYLLKVLKGGMKFIGLENDVFTFLRFKNEDVAICYCDGATYAHPLAEIKLFLVNKTDSTYIRLLEPIETIEEYNLLENKERVAIAVNFCRDLVFLTKGNFEILEIGNIVEGQAYYCEEEDNYKLIGLEIKYKYNSQGCSVVNVGFFPIYVDESIPEYYPISFTESYRETFGAQGYENGLGDKVEIHKVLIPKEKLKDVDIDCRIDNRIAIM